MEKATIPAKAGAEYLGLSYWKTLEMVKAGKLPHIRVGGDKAGRVLFRRESLDRWLEEQENASVCQAEPDPVGKIRRLK